METLLKVEKKNLKRVKDILLKDEIISRASILIKEGKSLGLKEGYYCYVSGTEEACNRTKKSIKSLGKIILGKYKEKIIGIIKREEESAMISFGKIFG